MSLLSEAMEECIILDKQTAPDGYGGVITRYVEGAHIACAIVLNSSNEAMIAQQLGAQAQYTITTRKSVNLQEHDVLKRLNDGKIFRVKSDGDDKHTPASAGLNMRQVTAEEYVLPAD